MQRRDFIALASVLMASAPTLAWADATQDQTEARAFVSGLHRELLAAIKASKDPKSDPKLLEIFNRILDYKYLTNETLGKNAEGVTPAQLEVYSDVLKRLVQASYRRNLRDPSGFEIEYTGETPVGAAVLVQTLTKSKKNKREKPLSVDYQVAIVDGARRVQDVSTGGVSLVKNYKKQFGGIIHKRGMDELLKMMNERLAELEGK